MQFDGYWVCRKSGFGFVPLLHQVSYSVLCGLLYYKLVYIQYMKQHHPASKVRTVLILLQLQTLYWEVVENSVYIHTPQNCSAIHYPENLERQIARFQKLRQPLTRICRRNLSHLLCCQYFHPITQGHGRSLGRRADALPIFFMPKNNFLLATELKRVK